MTTTVCVYCPFNVSGVVPRLVELLRHTSKMVVASALRAVGNILLGDDTQTQVAKGMLYEWETTRRPRLA